MKGIRSNLKDNILLFYKGRFFWITFILSILETIVWNDKITL